VETVEYVIYSAESREGTIINMTHNPELDLGYLKDAYGISGIKVLTPYMPAAYGHYVLSNMARDYNPLRRILPRAKELNERLRYESLKKLLKDIGETPLKKPEVVVEAGSFPSDEDMLKVYEEYKCRIVESENVYKNTSVFLENDIYDIVQMLYLNGKLLFVPPVAIEKPGRRYVCSHCGENIANYDTACEIVCEGCGTSIADGPFLAFPDDRLDKRPGRVKYKEYRKLDFYQATASSELSKFMDGSSQECLLWSVPGSLNCSMLMESVRKVLDAGGRVGIGVPEQDDEDMFLGALKDAFPGLSCLDRQQQGSGILDLVVCDYGHIADYYRAFDLLIV
jgi:hypothetical protein